jgi:pyruvate formate lyase activating enzyme
MINALLFEKLEDQKVHCFLCAHNCLILPQMYGFCGVRKNIDGDLYTYAYGKLIAQNVDPIEKKPLFHVKPGSKSFSVAVSGCNFRCGFCQNWQISQKKATDNRYLSGETYTPAQIVKKAINLGCESISFTYTEPTIFFEYAFETAKIAKDAGLITVFVSNGYMTSQAIKKISPYLDACNIDLKSFREEFYSKFCKAHLKPVKDSIKELYESHIWIEITTLLITGENDSEQEINDIAQFISGISTGIPWHVSRFFPQYEFSDHKPTPVATIFKALDAGNRMGLKFVYPGNVSEKCDTVCPSCKEILVSRSHFEINKNRTIDGRCPKCDREIEGIWK